MFKTMCGKVRRCNRENRQHGRDLRFIIDAKSSPPVFHLNSGLRHHFLYILAWLNRHDMNGRVTHFGQETIDD
jgi:hypothetical protein